jgi:hypothetical protein
MDEYNTYIISLENKTEHTIRAASKDEAVDLATELFSKRKPDVHIEIDNDAEPDIVLD